MTLLSVSSAVFLIDAWYYRFFRDLPSLHLLQGWHQAGPASESLLGLIRGEDLLLPLFPVVFLGAWRLWVKVDESAENRSRRRDLGILAVSVLLLAATVATLPEVRAVQLQRRFQNVAIGKIFGPIFYHLYDAWEWGRLHLGLEGGLRFDQSKVAPLVSRSRQSLREPTEERGRFANRDLIFIQLESLQDFALHAEVDGRPLMPFLRAAAQAGTYFRLLDQTHLGRSADGQFLFLQSLHPPASRPVPFAYPSHRYVGLPTLFRDAGYSTLYFHPSEPTFWNAETMSQSYGFEHRWFRRDLPAQNPLEDRRGWGLVDSALLAQVADHLKEQTSPYFAYVVTVMCHHPYGELKPEDVDFPKPVEGSMLVDYLRCCHFRDQALREFVEDLAQTERGRETVLFLAGDHDAQLPERELLSAGYDGYPQSRMVPGVLFTVEDVWSILESESALPPVLTGTFGGQIDVAPTLSHVFSLGMEESLFLGVNLFSTQDSGPVISRSGVWMDRKGWIQQFEGSEKVPDLSEFEASEMLLHGDRLEWARDSL